MSCNVEMVLNTRKRRREWLVRYEGDEKARWVKRTKANRGLRPETQYIVRKVGAKVRLPREDPRFRDRHFRYVWYQGFLERDLIPCRFLSVQ